jgi:hypothetical protein
MTVTVFINKCTNAQQGIQARPAKGSNSAFGIPLNFITFVQLPTDIPALPKYPSVVGN